MRNAHDRRLVANKPRGAGSRLFPPDGKLSMDFSAPPMPSPTTSQHCSRCLNGEILGRSVGDSQHTWFAVTGPNGRGRAQAFDGGTIDIEQSTQAFLPTVFLYDNYPGGIRLSTPLYNLRATVVTKTHDLIAACPCLLGCPTCIGPILASDETHSPKAAALSVLALFQR